MRVVKHIAITASHTPMEKTQHGRQHQAEEIEL